MTNLLNELVDAEAEFNRFMLEHDISDAALEEASGNGGIADGRSTPGDGTSNPGVNCTCCCN
jgi:hypothetical protein